MSDNSFSSQTLDDLLRDVFRSLLARGEPTTSTKGESLELFGVLLEIVNPRARLSRTETRGKLFSCLGELCWYLAKTDDLPFIYYYIPEYEKYADENRVYGGYGPRIFQWDGIDQFRNVRELLARKTSSRQAVIQLFDRTDIVEQQENTPCTCSLQFVIRREKLHLMTNMRSNDAYIGLPHDVFCFTMLQEILARTLGLDVGLYKHAVGSLHIYNTDIADAEQFLSEGLQSTTTSMPPIPEGDPWPDISGFLRCEAALRSDQGLPNEADGLAPYWRDLARLLEIFRFKKQSNFDAITALRPLLQHNVYRVFVDKVLSDFRLKVHSRRGMAPHSSE